MLRPCSTIEKPIRNRFAFTLIEVLVGMFLLATLAVVALQGFRAHKLQLKFAEQRIVAVAELDRMLSIWSSQPAGIPMIGAGAVAPDRPWAWKSSVIEQRVVFGQPLNIVRIEVYEGIDQDAKRLCYVDIMRLNER